MRVPLPLRCVACLLPLLIGLLPCAGQPAPQPGAGAPLPKLRGRQGEVTQLVYSPDGKRLAAAYYVHAINRPGTDWDAWVVAWDLQTGKRTVLRRGTGPVAFSPDSRTLAAGLYERSREPGFRQRPFVRLALWRPGEGTPARVLGAPFEEGEAAAGKKVSAAGSVVAFAFHPDGKHVAVASQGGVWWQPLGEDAQPQRVATLRLSPSARAVAPSLTFGEQGTVLAFQGTRVSGTKEMVAAISWRVERSPKGTSFKLRREERPVRREDVGKPPAAAGLAVRSPDGTQRAAATADGTIRVTDAQTGKLIRELRPRD